MKAFLTSFTILLLLSSPVYAEEAFQVGTAEIEITPPVGYRIGGNFNERFTTGIKDPLMAKAIVFSQGETKGVLVICDLVAIFRNVSVPARKHIAQELSIPSEQVCIAATHSHTGPLYSGALRDQFHRVAIEREGTDPHEKVNYAEFLVEKIMTVTSQADNKLQPVDIQAGYGFENRIAFNRRFITKDGSARTWIGINHPDVVRVAGPIDTEISLIQFTNPDDRKPVSLISSYALHLDTTGGTEYSGDFPYYLSRNLKEKFGNDFISIFGAGTCGDINHVDTGNKKRNKTELIGEYYTESVLKALPELQPVKKPSLKILSRVVDVKKQEFTEEELAEAKEIMPKMNDSSIPFLKKVKSRAIMELAENQSETLPYEVQAFRISTDLAIVTLPGEIFVELGMQIKQNSPFKTTLVIELANSAPGYIPTRKAFAEGSYETVNSRGVPGCGEELVEVATELLNRLNSNEE